MRGVSEKTWARVYKIDAHTKQGGVCLYCKAPLPLSIATAEHVTPRKMNGKTRAHNIAAACLPCNNTRGSRPRAEFMRLIHEPDYKRDPWPLYLACMDIRLKLRVSAACRRLRSITKQDAAAPVSPEPRSGVGTPNPPAQDQ